MGCGRSKHRSKSSHDHDVPNGRAHKASGSAKHSRADQRESEDSGQNQGTKSGGAKKEKRIPKVAEPPPQRNSTASSSYSANGAVPHSGAEAMASLRADKLADSRATQDKKKTAFKDKVLTGNAQNPQITSSQLEFFRMLDERIEQGRDYDPDDD